MNQQLFKRSSKLTTENSVSALRMMSISCGIKPNKNIFFHNLLVPERVKKFQCSQQFTAKVIF